MALTTRARVITTLAATTTLLLSGCATTAEPAPQPVPESSSTIDAPVLVPLPVGEPVAVATGLTTPWSVVFLGDTALISSRDTGEIFELVGERTRLVGTVPGVVHDGESGLLGLAVDERRRLYTYSTSSSDNRIQRFILTGEPGSLGLGARELILDGIPSARTHDGGRLAFGPDGMLYATTGDARVPNASQDITSLGGKILRMTADGGIPDDNPFPGSLVYTLGHRNPQGIAWDADGRLFASEFGQNTWDELNIITAGSNYGWPEVEGIAGNPDFVDPVQQWNPEIASPSGIAIVGGTVFIANLRGQRVRTVPVADPSTETTFFEGEFGRIRDVAHAPDGSLWFLTSNTDANGTPGARNDRALRVELGE